MKAKINTKPLDQLIRRSRVAVKEYIKELDQEYQVVIADTYAFSDVGVMNQDIIWSGKLKQSQQMNIQDSKNIKANWVWDPVDEKTGEHYASDVLNGFTTWSGRNIPGRNWPSKAVERVEPIPFLIKKLKD